MITFSIITCTYNAADTCERTFTSVLHQTYPYVEHLILDGKSKDDTLAKIEKYKNLNEEDGKRHTVECVSEPDKGLYDAMNKGIAKATGDYLLFLNAGDTFPTENTLMQIVDSLGKNASLPAVLYGDTDIVDMNGNFVRHRRLSPPENLSWRSFKQGMLVCHQAFYVRTDLAKNIAYDLQYRFSADVDWCIRIMKEAEKMQLPLHNVHQVVVNYLEGGLTDKNHRDSLKERFRLMSRHYGLFQTVAMHIWFIFRSIIKK